jgi:hypothetical protein
LVLVAQVAVVAVVVTTYRQSRELLTPVAVAVVSAVILKVVLAELAGQES